RLRAEDGKLRAARADLEKAAALDPRAAWIFAWKGEVERKLGRHAQAVADYDRAIGINGRDWPSLIGRAAALAALRREDAAWRDLERVLHEAIRLGREGRREEAARLC